MPKPNKTEHHKKAMLDALQKTLSNVTASCKKVGIGRTTYYDWLSNDPEFAREVDNIKEMRLDYIEGKLMQGIDGGNMTAIIFALKTQGKHRGYVERQEITGQDNMPLKVNVEVVRKDE